MSPTSPTDPGSAPAPGGLGEITRLFLRLGAIGFGGPQAHIAMIHDEAVVRRGWLDEAQFLEGVAVCEMLPGPASTQMGIYTGYLRAGPLGALVAGTCFILPAFIIVLALSWAYFRFQGVPQITALFFGISPVVIAIILAFCWKQGQKVIRDAPAVAIALTVGLIHAYLQTSVLVLLLLAGLAGLVFYPPPRSGPGTTTNQQLWWIPWPGLLPVTTAVTQVPPETLSVASFWGLDRIQAYGLPLMGFFLEVGISIFGGGLVIIPLLESTVVSQFHWLTHSEFIDGVALGSITPGPVVITAAFVGYKVAGALGALAATVGIFAPSFAIIMVASPFLRRLRQRRWVKSFLQGVMPAVLAVLGVALLTLARPALIQATGLRTGVAVIIALLAWIALVRWRQPTWLLIPAGAVVGLIAGSLLLPG
ncbi:MAG: chromate efflux transporter [Cyanobacteria bacterium REEB459]|nr:chromate efflux transporter [Cyanobacteria bacterium REEB459]